MRLRFFLLGVLCGFIGMPIIGTLIALWATPLPSRSPEDRMVYDSCLAQGRTVTACEAVLRLYALARQ